MAQVTVHTVPHLRDFGLERLEEDRAIVGFAKKAEARLVRWLDFAKGALLFLMVPGDSESGTFYIYDRGRFSFYPLSLPIEQRYGGFGKRSSNLLRKPLTSLHLRGIRASCGPSAPGHFWSYLRHGP
jgi:hypothetical protein